MMYSVPLSTLRAASCICVCIVGCVPPPYHLISPSPQSITGGVHGLLTPPKNNRQSSPRDSRTSNIVSHATQQS